MSPLLFSIVMDCLVYYIAAAGLFKSMGRQGPKYRISSYAGDVVMFINPDANEMSMMNHILMVFGNASRLRANLSKSSYISIRCESMDINMLVQHSNYQIMAFPCTYLAIPLSYSSLKRIHYQAILDKSVKKRPGWQLPMNIVDRLILVKVVLCAMPTFQLITMAAPKWLS
jgi:hypothetical protein